MQIQIQDLSMTYPSGKQALQRLDLDLTSPSLVGLLGPNGAGKSTLMKLLVAALLPTQGSILVDGRPLDRSRAGARKPVWAISPSPSACIDELTVYQFLDYMAALKGLRNSRLRHRPGHPGRQSGGEAPGQNPHSLRRPAPAGGNRPGSAGRPGVPHL